MFTLDELRVFLVTVFILLEALAFVFCVIGNSIVIYVMTREKKLQRKSNYYIVSVAIADILVGLVVIPGSIYMRFTGGPENFFCLILIALMISLLAVSIFTLLAVSADRYIAVCHPIFYRKTFYAKSVKSVIGLCWFFGVLSVFPLFGWNFGVFNNKCHPALYLSSDYLVVLITTVCFFPTLIIIIVYCLAFKEINSQSRIRSTMISSPDDTSESTRNKEYKAAKTLSMVVGSFLVCWLPMAISYVIFAMRDQKFSERILDFCIIPSHFNSVIDPLIYAFRIKDVRDAMKLLIRCGKPPPGTKLISSGNLIL